MEPAIPLLALGAVAVYLLGKKDDEDQGDGQASPEGGYGQPPPQYGPPQGAPAPAPRYTAPPGPPPGPSPRPAPRRGPQPIPASDELLHLASNLYSIASAPGASCAAIAGPTAAFQQQAVADGHRLAVDGKYGPGPWRCSTQSWPGRGFALRRTSGAPVAAATPLRGRGLRLRERPETA